jgi:hypothetical protein
MKGSTKIEKLEQAQKAIKSVIKMLSEVDEDGSHMSTVLAELEMVGGNDHMWLGSRDNLDDWIKEIEDSDDDSVDEGQDEGDEIDEDICLVCEKAQSECECE